MRKTGKSTVRRVYCDLHLHSCLSPCGDDGMTPATAAGMAKLAGLEVAALTDHNTVRNCPAFFKACAAYGIGALAGMELTTAEDIHLVCLFRDCAAAEVFETALAPYRVHIRNRPEFFGRQLVTDENDAVLYEEPDLLPNAMQLPLEEAFALTQNCGGVCYPAHIDRESNGILAVLGTFPEKPAFRHFELHDLTKLPVLLEEFPQLNGLQQLYGSDAHRPQDVPDRQFFLEVPDGDAPEKAVFTQLKGAYG